MVTWPLLAAEALEGLRTKIYCDSGDLAQIYLYSRYPMLVHGFTTNPSLMKASGITDYTTFAKLVLESVGKDRPVSFEVITDDPTEMLSQARGLSALGANVFVKVPVTDTHGRFMKDVIKTLSDEGIKLNVTAIMTMQQVHNVLDVISHDTQSIISVFAGRIADTGRDPYLIMKDAVDYLAGSKSYLLWASCREVLNIFQAEECGCDIITVPPEMLLKLPLVGKNLDEYSLETVRQFHRDGMGLSL